MVPVDAASAVVLLEFKDSYGLGFVAPNGRIVSCFHVVVDEPEIIAHLSDGRALPVERVASIDIRRDLVVLDVGVLDITPLRAPTPRLAAEGSGVVVFGMVQSVGRARWVEARIDAVQVLGSGLSVYRVSGAVPPDASGGPLVAADGTVLGVVTVAEADEGVVTLGVPWRYVDSLLAKNQGLPLSALQRATRKPPKREIPAHPLSLLDGSSASGLAAATQAMSGAIRVGAPAYNEGDIDACYRVYAETARRLIDSRPDCPGVKRALQAGLARAEKLDDIDHQAWAMRDTFDGLLAVIERFFKEREPSLAATKRRMMN